MKDRNGESVGLTTNRRTPACVMGRDVGREGWDCKEKGLAWFRDPAMTSPNQRRLRVDCVEKGHFGRHLLKFRAMGGRRIKGRGGSHSAPIWPRIVFSSPAWRGRGRDFTYTGNTQQFSKTTISGFFNTIGGFLPIDKPNLMGLGGTWLDVFS